MVTLPSGPTTLYNAWAGPYSSKADSAIAINANQFVFLSGPEGGLAPAEEQGAISLGWAAITLGVLKGFGMMIVRLGAGAFDMALFLSPWPDDWKPMKTIGPGVREIRIREKSGAFRVIYLATLPDAVLVLHAFQKKTQATPRKDIDLAASRLRAWKE